MNKSVKATNGNHRLSLDSIVKLTRDQASCELVGEAVILDLKTGVYYGVDSVGARIWTLIQEHKTVGAIRDALMSEYDVSPDQCTHDLLVFLELLKKSELVEICYETVA
jgi:hypothetical protein